MINVKEILNTLNGFDERKVLINTTGAISYLKQDITSLFSYVITIEDKQYLTLEDDTDECIDSFKIDLNKVLKVRNNSFKKDLDITLLLRNTEINISTELV